MKILLGSGGVGTEERREMYRSLMLENFSDCKKVAFVPYASGDHAGYTKRMREFSGEEIDLVGIHEFDDPVSALGQMNGIYVGGGNTWLLVRELHARGLIEPLRDAVKDRGLPYAGVSAGANVACPTMQTTNDMPITMVPSFETLGLVPFQINPHYYPGGIWFKEEEKSGFLQHYGETRSRRISEFHQNRDEPVIGLYEGSYLRSKGDYFELLGNKAALFRKGEDLVTVEPGTLLTSDLTAA
jgi:dipeptidase E